MTKTYKTVEDCAHLWVSEFNAIPTMMVSELMNVDPDSWREVTEPSSGAVVFVAGNVGTVETVRDGEALVHLANGLCFWVPKGKCEVDYCDALPMWGTMWSFSDPCDIWWVEEGDGVEVLSRCGFRVFYHEEYGYFFGIDGAGYSFYDEHWIPMYLDRGLRWHMI